MSSSEQKPKWERRGDCNNCGWCCQFLQVQRVTIHPHAVTPDTRKFFELRNGSLQPDGAMRVVTHVFNPCTAHDLVNKRCTVYADRPEVCKAFPTLPDQIEGSPCTYWFERTLEDGSVERRGGLDSPHPTPPQFEGGRVKP